MESKILSVYRLAADYDNYLAFQLPMKDLIVKFGKTIPAKNLMHFYKHNVSLAEIWSEVSGDFINTKKTTSENMVPDATLWSSGALVFSDKSKQKLESYLNEMGEFLSVHSPFGKFWIFNCLNVVSADEAESSRIVQDGQVLEVNKIFFQKDDTERNLIFKTDFDAGKGVYCNDFFFNLITSMDIRGLTFKKNLVDIF